MNLTSQLLYWLAQKLMDASAEYVSDTEEMATFMDAAEALTDAADLIVEIEGD